MRVVQPFGFDRRKRGDGLHQRFGGAAGFRDGDEARRLVRQLAEQRGKAVAIEVVHEMQARR